MASAMPVCSSGDVSRVPNVAMAEVCANGGGDGSLPLPPSVAESSPTGRPAGNYSPQGDGEEGSGDGSGLVSLKPVESSHTVNNISKVDTHNSVVLAVAVPATAMAGGGSRVENPSVPWLRRCQSLPPLNQYKTRAAKAKAPARAAIEENKDGNGVLCDLPGWMQPRCGDDLWWRQGMGSDGNDGAKDLFVESILRWRKSLPSLLPDAHSFASSEIVDIMGDASQFRQRTICLVGPTKGESQGSLHKGGMPKGSTRCMTKRCGREILAIFQKQGEYRHVNVVADQHVTVTAIARQPPPLPSPCPSSPMSSRGDGAMAAREVASPDTKGGRGRGRRRSKTTSRAKKRKGKGKRTVKTTHVTTIAEERPGATEATEAPAAAGEQDSTSHDAEEEKAVLDEPRGTLNNNGRCAQEEKAASAATLDDESTGEQARLPSLPALPPLPPMEASRERETLSLGELASFGEYNALHYLELSSAGGFNIVTRATGFMPGHGVVVICRFIAKERVTRQLVCRQVMLDAGGAKATALRAAGGGAVTLAVESARGASAAGAGDDDAAEDKLETVEYPCSEVYNRVGPAPLHVCHFWLRRAGEYRLSYSDGGDASAAIIVGRNLGVETPGLDIDQPPMPVDEELSTAPSVAVAASGVDVVEACGSALIAGSTSSAPCENSMSSDAEQAAVVDPAAGGRDNAGDKTGGGRIESSESFFSPMQTVHGHPQHGRDDTNKMGGRSSCPEDCISFGDFPCPHSVGDRTSDPVREEGKYKAGRSEDAKSATHALTQKSNLSSWGAAKEGKGWRKKKRRRKKNKKNDDIVDKKNEAAAFLATSSKAERLDNTGDKATPCSRQEACISFGDFSLQPDVTEPTTGACTPSSVGLGRERAMAAGSFGGKGGGILASGRDSWTAGDARCGEGSGDALEPNGGHCSGGQQGQGPPEKGGPRTEIQRGRESSASTVVSAGLSPLPCLGDRPGRSRATACIVPAAASGASAAVTTVLAGSQTSRGRSNIPEPRWGNCSTKISVEERKRRSQVLKGARLPVSYNAGVKVKNEPTPFPEESRLPGGGFYIPEGPDDELPPPSAYEVEVSAMMMQSYNDIMSKLKESGNDTPLANGYTPKIYDLTA